MKQQLDNVPWGRWYWQLLQQFLGDQRMLETDLASMMSQGTVETASTEQQHSCVAPVAVSHTFHPTQSVASKEVDLQNGVT